MGTPNVSSYTQANQQTTSIQGQLRNKIAKQLNLLQNLPEDAPESAVEERIGALNDLIGQTHDPKEKAAVKRMIEDAIHQRLSGSEGKKHEGSERLKLALEMVKIGNETLETAATVEKNLGKVISSTVSSDTRALSRPLGVLSTVTDIGKPVLKNLGPAATLIMAHTITQAPIEQQGEQWLGFGVSLSAGLTMAEAGAKFTPGGPIPKGIAALVLGVAGTFGGEAAVKDLVEKHPDLKAFLESRNVQILAYGLQMSDPINLATMVIDSKRGMAEVKEKMSFVAANGPEAWDAEVSREIDSINLKIASAMERGNEGEVTKLTAHRSKLEASMYKLDRNKFSSDRAYQQVVNKIKGEAQSFVEGRPYANAGVYG